MRVFELTAHVKSISRSAGSSATAAAAYRACVAIECEREGRTHDYRRKAGLEASAIILPAGAPAWAQDRSKLWNAAELRERNGKRGKNAGAFKADAVTAREFMFGFPAELSQAGRLSVAGIVARHLADAHGVAADFSIHQPGKEGDQRNFHCHMMTTSRRLTAKGLDQKTREWDDLKSGAALVKQFRAFLATTMTAELTAEGKAGAVKIEHLSFAERGSGQTPTKHQGPSKTNQFRKEKGRARDAWAKTERANQSIRQQKELAALKVRHDMNLAARSGELDERAKRGADAIMARLAADNAAAPPAPTGMSRVFQVITGRAMRADFERQAAAAARTDAAHKEVEALNVAIRAERNALVKTQQQERAALVARHAAERDTINAAITVRQTIDRAGEVQRRQDDALDRSHNHERDGRDRPRDDRRHESGPGLSL